MEMNNDNNNNNNNNSSNNNNNNNTDVLSNYIEFHIGMYIGQYYPPVIIILGTLGNLLTFIVYGKHRFRSRPPSIYMRSLAVLDSILLLIGLLSFWLITNFLPQA